MAGQKIELGDTGTTVAANVKRLRGATSYVNLSKRLDELHRKIPPLALRRIEEGKRRVDVDDLMALAVALGVTPITLLMPYGGDAYDPVVVTALPGKNVGAAVWAWLQGTLGRPGAEQIRIDTWPKWVQSGVLADAVIKMDATGVGSRGDDK